MEVEIHLTTTTATRNKRNRHSAINHYPMHTSIAPKVNTSYGGNSMDLFCQAQEQKPASVSIELQFGIFTSMRRLP